MSGFLRRTTISAGQIRSALAQPLERISGAVKDVLDRTPAELSADLIEEGITVVGGGALLPGIDALLAAQTGLPVTIADTPLLTVAQGAGQALEEMDTSNRSSKAAEARSGDKTRRVRFNKCRGGVVWRPNRTYILRVRAARWSRSTSLCC